MAGEHLLLLDAGEPNRGFHVSLAKLRRTSGVLIRCTDQVYCKLCASSVGM